MWRAFQAITNIYSRQLGGSHYRLVSATTSSKDKDLAENDSNLSLARDPISEFTKETDLKLNSHVNTQFNCTHVKRQLTEVKSTFIENKIDNPQIKDLSAKFKLNDDSKETETENCLIEKFSSKLKLNDRRKPKGHSGSVHTRKKLPSIVSEVLEDSSLKSVERSSSKAIQNDAVYQGSDNSEEFGTLAGLPQHENYVGDELDVKSENPAIPNHSERREINYYSSKMKELINQGKLQEAMQVIEHEMPAVRAWPDTYCYRTIIRGCATVGDTKKAFSFYNQLKKQGLMPKPRIWAQLFVACGHSHSQKDGLARASKLRNQLKAAGAPLTEEVYHTMIRAFGRCGDIDTAFQVVDDMVANKIFATTTTFNSLLHACLFDKEAGFRHAIMVWRRMRLLRCTPDLYSYNLMVRCTQCGAGDPALLAELLRAATENPEEVRKKHKEEKQQKQLAAALQDSTRSEFLPQVTVDSSNHKIVVEGKQTASTSPETEVVRSHFASSAVKGKYFPSAEQEASATSSHLDEGQDWCAPTMVPSEAAPVETLMPPNILAQHPSPGAVMELTELVTPTDRLAVVGGSLGVLQQMERDGVQPDIKTFTLLLAALPHSLELEEALLRSMSSVGLEPDVTLCNMLIRRRAIRRGDDSYKMALSLLSQYHLLPNIMTYGCLALTCRTLPDARDLLADMDKANMSPNLVIMKSLVGCALRDNRYFYALEMLRATHQFGLQPDEQMLKELEERGREAAKRNMRELERKREEGAKLTRSDQAHLHSCHTFLLEYRQWLQNSSVRRKEVPWGYRSQVPPLEQSVP